MNKTLLLIVFGFTFLLGCNKEDEESEEPVAIQTCPKDASLDGFTLRSFKMGFSTWSFGPNESDRSETYQFIQTNADIYSEQIDNKIPWNAWITNSPLPQDFINDIDYRVSKKINNHQLLLSVSLLNTERNDLLEDYDGTVPNYTSLNDSTIENAYVQHLLYLISRFDPDYLVIAMECNELKIHSETKWDEYKLLMSNVRSRIKTVHPNLPLSESVTLHNWYEPNVTNPTDFIMDISNYVNQNMDFSAISYYPFFKGQRTKAEFQKAFDFLHAEVNIPISFVETTHLAEDLIVNSFNINIESDVCEQKKYLETLLLNAYNKNYQFVIWWAHKDYDLLWSTFPPDVRDIGKLWRDTGLLNEAGEGRPSLIVWNNQFNK